MKYTQPKRNAYKIKSNGQYGGLMIDLPKLIGQLRLVASKNGEKVLDEQADFDTIDLLTKRFNSKRYSPVSQILFDQLNKLSEILIHRSSKKFSKIGSGVVYYNNINEGYPVRTTFTYAQTKPITTGLWREIAAAGRMFTMSV